MAHGLFYFFLFFSYISSREQNHRVLSEESCFFDNQRVDASEDKAYSVENCVFYRVLPYFGNGGSIYMVNSELKLKISLCVFRCCMSLFDGGAIYFKAEQAGKLMVEKVCASKCYTADNGNYGQFLLSIMGQNGSFSVSYASITMCAIGNANQRHCSLLVTQGTQTMQNVNSSKNQLTTYSSFAFQDGQSLEAKYNTIYSNKAFDFSACGLFVSGFYISYTNFVENTQKNEMGIIYSSMGGTLEYCVFLKNSNYLFVADNFSLTIQKSYLYHESLKIFQGLVILNSDMSENNQYTTLIIDHFSSAFCETPDSSFCPTPSNMFTIDNTPYLTIDLTIDTTLDSRLDQTIARTVRKTKKQTKLPTFQITPEMTPIITFDQTHDLTPYSTHDKTLQSTNEMTPIITFDQTHDLTPYSTHDETLQPTDEMTPIVTFDQTHDLTPYSTHDETLQPTDETTPIITFDQTQNLSPESTFIPSNTRTPSHVFSIDQSPAFTPFQTPLLSRSPAPSNLLNSLEDLIKNNTIFTISGLIVVSSLVIFAGMKMVSKCRSSESESSEYTFDSVFI